VLKYVARDAAGLWSPPAVVDGAQESGEFSAVSAAGGVRAGYLRKTRVQVGTVITYLYALRFASLGGTWSTAVIDDADNAGGFISIAVDADGLVHLIYFGYGTDDLRHAYLCK